METNRLINSFRSKYAFCLILLIAPSSGYTANCFNNSPNTVKGKLATNPIKVHTLSHDEKNNVRTILKSLQGQWEGNAIGYWCLGTKQNPRTKPDNYTIIAEGKRKSSNSVIIKADLYNAEKKSSHPETMRLILDGSLLRIDSPSSIGDIDIISITSNNITFIQQYRNRAASGGSIFREIERSIIVYDSTLDINHKVYTQGELSSESTWKLSRTR